MTPIKGRLSVKGTKASGAQIGLVTPITILRAKSQWSGATWGKLLLVPLSLSAVTALFMIWSWCSITLNLCRKCLIREVRVSAKHDSLLPRFVSRSWATFGVFVNGNVSHCPAILVYWYIIWCPQSEFFLYLYLLWDSRTGHGQQYLFCCRDIPEALSILIPVVFSYSGDVSPLKQFSRSLFLDFRMNYETQLLLGKP